MNNIVLLLACLVIGFALRRFGRVPENAHATLNAFIINVAFPALILTQVHNLHLKPDLLLSVMMPWLMFIVGAILFWIIARYLPAVSEYHGCLDVDRGAWKHVLHWLANDRGVLR